MSTDTRRAAAMRAVLEVLESYLKELADRQDCDLRLHVDARPAGYSADLVFAVRLTPKAAA